jgi:hypothetical protein
MPEKASPDPLMALSDEALAASLPHAAALPDAPAAWRARALAAWRAPVTLASLAAGVRQHIQAVLSFDSWATAPLAAGLRSTGSATRQLVFSAEGRDVDLRISPQGAQFAIRGQVLGPDETGSVALAPEPAAAAAPEDQAEATQACALDGLGEFHLGSVAPGRYCLRLRLPEHEVVLPPFDVGGPIRFQPKDGAAG